MAEKTIYVNWETHQIVGKKEYDDLITKYAKSLMENSKKGGTDSHKLLEKCIGGYTKIDVFYMTEEERAKVIADFETKCKVLAKTTYSRFEEITIDV